MSLGPALVPEATPAPGGAPESPCFAGPLPPYSAPVPPLGAAPPPRPPTALVPTAPPEPAFPLLPLGDELPAMGAAALPLPLAGAASLPTPCAATKRASSRSKPRQISEGQRRFALTSLSPPASESRKWVRALPTERCSCRPAGKVQPPTADVARRVGERVAAAKAVGCYPQRYPEPCGRG